MRWVLNVATSYLKFLVNMVVVFFLTPYIVAKIGIDAFGLWTLVFAIIGILGLMDFGFATAAVKYVAECIGAKDHERLGELVSTLFVLYAAIGIACIGAVALAAGPAASLFGLDTGDAQSFTHLVWLLGLVVAASFPASVFRAAMTGAGRMDVVNGIALLLILAQAGLTVWLLESGYGLIGLAIAASVSLLGQTLLLAPFAYRMVQIGRAHV